MSWRRWREVGVVAEDPRREWVRKRVRVGGSGPAWREDWAGPCTEKGNCKSEGGWVFGFINHIKRERESFCYFDNLGVEVSKLL